LILGNLPPLRYILIHNCLPYHANFLPFNVEPFKPLEHLFLVICNSEVIWKIHKPFFL
jgi:hypothetical protein